VTSSVAVFEAATWVKSMYMTKFWRKKEKVWKSHKLLHKPPSDIHGGPQKVSHYEMIKKLY